MKALALSAIGLGDVLPFLIPLILVIVILAILASNIRVVQQSKAVVIRGVVWTARSEDGLPVPAGALVRVLRIEGVKVFVERVPAEAGARPEAW